ncbi:MAG: hypothetical protein J3K34DRAFT_442018 [Monoraphidium minutum]|nr:MAG: hypothetical protein J3K34DRAFT_442018 [Monoraphidium minutum]
MALAPAPCRDGGPAYTHSRPARLYCAPLCLCRHPSAPAFLRGPPLVWQCPGAPPFWRAGPHRAQRPHAGLPPSGGRHAFCITLSTARSSEATRAASARPNRPIRPPRAGAPRHNRLGTCAPHPPPSAGVAAGPPAACAPPSLAAVPLPHCPRARRAPATTRWRQPPPRWGLTARTPVCAAGAASLLLWKNRCGPAHARHCFDPLSEADHNHAPALIFFLAPSLGLPPLGRGAAGGERHPLPPPSPPLGTTFALRSASPRRPPAHAAGCACRAQGVTARRHAAWVRVGRSRREVGRRRRRPRAAPWAAARGRRPRSCHA